MNYFWIPLVLSVLGMIWLWRDARGGVEPDGTPASELENQY